MIRHKWIWLLTGALVVASAASCYPPALVPAGETGAPPAIPRVTAHGLPAGPTAESAIPTPPVEIATRTLTAVPLTPAAPISTEEKTVVTGVPIPPPLDPALQKIVAQAQEDLAGRLHVDNSQVELVEVQSVIWPDGSLGCPQPDMGYVQVQVDGLLIRMRAGDRIYEYHSGSARAPFLCEQG